MGRPVNKRYFGVTGVDATPKIPVRFHDGSSGYEGYIVAQKGTNKFKVATADTSPPVELTGRLVNEISPNGTNEVSLVGIAAGGDPVLIKKIFNRTAVDWNNNRYTWEVQDDSTESLLVLTAI